MSKKINFASYKKGNQKRKATAAGAITFKADTITEIDGETKIHLRAGNVVLNLQIDRTTATTLLSQYKTHEENITGGKIFYFALKPSL